MASGSGRKADPGMLKTAPGTSEYTMYIDEAADPPAIVCQVGSTHMPPLLEALGLAELTHDAKSNRMRTKG